MYSEQALAKLNDAATQQEFKPWELEDNLYRIKLDLAALTPEVCIADVMRGINTLTFLNLLHL